MTQKWSEGQISFLKKYYVSLPIENLSETLGKSADAIYSRAKRLGLKREFKHREPDKKPVQISDVKKLSSNHWINLAGVTE